MSLRTKLNGIENVHFVDDRTIGYDNADYFITIWPDEFVNRRKENLESVAIKSRNESWLLLKFNGKRTANVEEQVFRETLDVNG